MQELLRQAPADAAAGGEKMAAAASAAGWERPKTMAHPYEVRSDSRNTFEYS